ncbi:hypothetical protein NW762_011655 [Fusarium torreyae]|uniref:Uncharacterized protein n=1 Tax=Fusarium torreyae TaxID=1237075 RepID=A0A9W8RS34_9HYPO|nr:hypothetical protein NW762_011655 [Fusarium torreyae]
MKFAVSVGFLLAIWSSSALAAEDRSPERVCYDSCVACLQPVHFDDMLRNQTGFTATCYSPKAILSLYLCLNVYCMPGAREAGLSPLNETCRDHAHVVLPPFDVISNYTAKDIEKIRRLEQNDTQEVDTFREVVIPSKHWFGIWWDTLDSVAYTYTKHAVYGNAMIVFWVVVVTIGVLNHAVLHIANLQVVRSHTSKSGGTLWNFYTWTLSRLTTPATYGDRCAQKVGWGTVPPRIQSLTLFAFLLLNIALSIHGYRIVPINM